jgi:hypothetical protein
LPLVSATPAIQVAKFATGVVDAVVHLHLRISPQIKKINRIDPKVIFGGLGEDDS